MSKLRASNYTQVFHVGRGYSKMWANICRLPGAKQRQHSSGDSVLTILMWDAGILSNKSDTPCPNAPSTFHEFLQWTQRYVSCAMACTMYLLQFCEMFLVFPCPTASWLGCDGMTVPYLAFWVWLKLSMASAATNCHPGRHLCDDTPGIERQRTTIKYQRAFGKNKWQHSRNRGSPFLFLQLSLVFNSIDSTSIN